MSDENFYGVLMSEPELMAGFLWRAMKYIIQRRPHELMTIAILNEKAYDVYDAVQGAARAKQIN